MNFKILAKNISFCEAMLHSAALILTPAFFIIIITVKSSKYNFISGDGESDG
jgi:hypothetical protein